MKPRRIKYSLTKRESLVVDLMRMYRRMLSEYYHASAADMREIIKKVVA